MPRIKTHHELEVYKLSFQAGMEIFKVTKSFPKEETYSLTDQIRRSSRSVSIAVRLIIIYNLYSCQYIISNMHNYLALKWGLSKSG